MNKKRERSRQGRRRKKKHKTDLDTVMADFVACGRCSFFLTGYRALHGVENLENAVDASVDAWLVLAWDHETRRLVQSSYGSRLDVGFYYYDGRCPECQRRYVIGSGDEAVEPAQDETETITPEPTEPHSLRVALTVK